MLSHGAQAHSMPHDGTSHGAGLGPAVVLACARVRLPASSHQHPPKEDLMASRRPTEPPRPEVAKEIPKVIKADEKAAPAPARARAKSPTEAAAAVTSPAGTPRVRKTAAKMAPARVTISEDVRRGMI